MKKVVVLMWLLCLSVPAFALDGREVMVRNFNAGTVLDWLTMSKMVLIDSKGRERVRTGKSVNKLQPNGVYYNRLYRYFSPQDIQGTAVLVLEHQGDDDMWIYLPAMKKTRRITSGNKRDSFVGSDFSYGDVVSPKVEEYNHTLRGKELLDGVECYRVESVAKNEKVVRDTGYSKKISWVRTDNFVEKKIDYFDETGAPLKTQFISGLHAADSKKGKWIAMRREMKNHQSDHRTVISFDRIESGKGIKDGVFSVRSLERSE